MSWPSFTLRLGSIFDKVPNSLLICWVHLLCQTDQNCAKISLSRRTKWIMATWMTQGFTAKLQSYPVYSHHLSRDICVKIQQSFVKTLMWVKIWSSSLCQVNHNKENLQGINTHKHRWWGQKESLPRPSHSKSSVFFWLKFLHFTMPVQSAWRGSSLRQPLILLVFVLFL